MKYKHQFNQCKALRFRHFSRKGYALFACLGRVVTIGVLSVATLRAAAVTSDSLSVVGGSPVNAFGSDDGTNGKEVTLDEVEVTGSRAPLALGQAARMVTVLSREDVQAAPVQSINDLLKYAVGVDVRQRGPLGAQTDVSIRGGTQEQIAVLLNGINICDPQTGHNSFDLPCDLSDIVRIEVLEGPAGRAYGTSSLVGAINIVTSSSPKLGEVWRGLDARIEGGSYGCLSTAGRVGISNHSLSANYTRSDGYQRAKSGALNSDYQCGKAFYQGGYSADGLRLNWHAGLSMKGFGSNTFYSAKFDEQYEHTTKLYTALQGDVRCQMSDGRSKMSEWHLKPAVYWNRSYDRFELIRGMEDKVPFNHHRTDVFGVNINSFFDWSLGRTAFGAEMRHEGIVSSNLGEPLNAAHGDYRFGLNRTNISLHLEHNVLLRWLTLSAGFIAAKNTWSEMPLTVYPGVDASVRLSECWKVYGSYNSSLRMPSFTELYYSVGGHKADKYLAPEELRAVESGIKYTDNWLTVKGCIFHHHGRNMIDWVLDTTDPQAVWQSVNLTRINTFGQEITLNAQFPWLRHSLKERMLDFQLSYSHLHQQKDIPSNWQSQYSLEYLRHKVTAQLRMPLTACLGLSLNYRWQDRTGTYTKADGEVRSYHPYSVVDARLTWDTAACSVYVEGNNLTGHRYVDFGHVPQPGCWVTMGAKWQLSF
jgi:iron complex outermembrane receptor protein